MGKAVFRWLRAKLRRVGVYDRVHAVVPKTPMLASEIASEIGTRGFYGMSHWENYWGDRERGYVAAYSINAGPGGQTVENAWPPVATKEFMAGGFVWSGFDYKGEPRPFEWPVINCHYGFMDICGFPKDSYYYYKAWWTDQPVLAPVSALELGGEGRARRSPCGSTATVRKWSCSSTGCRKASRRSSPTRIWNGK